jgi:hypothetical protein
MPFLILPMEIINNILILLSVNDLIELFKTCRITNKYIYIYLKCNICNLKIKKKQDIYNFKNCSECKETVCKNCQTFCNNYDFCDNIYCEYCLVTDLCEECYEILKNSSDEEDEI